MDHHDLNTGHHYKVVVFDSMHHISNGTYKHLMHMFAQPWTKNTDNPISHHILTVLNWHTYLHLMPIEGNYGIMYRTEPSNQYDVSNIDLSVRLNFEHVESDYVYTPATKLNARLTYAVKNKEQSLKTWDMNAVLDLNNGHTVNNLKMQLTRIVPGQKDYKICVDGVKKWTNKGVSGHLNIAMSQSADGKCTKDDSVVDVTMTGEPSEEQLSHEHKYGSCQYPIPYSIPHYHTLHCLVSHTTVRKYMYNVKTTNIPTQFKHYLLKVWDHVKGFYMDHYEHEEQHNEDIGENNFKVDVLYPMQGSEVDMYFSTPQHQYSLTAIPTQQLHWWGLMPDSKYYPKQFVYLHKYNVLDHCEIHHDHMHFNQKKMQKEIPSEWTLYAGNADKNPQHAVYVKQLAKEQLVRNTVF